MEMNLDKFGEMMDEFLKREDIVMLVRLPKGTLEAKVKDNIKCGSTVQFYLLLNALKTVAEQVRKDMGITDSEEWKRIVDSLTELLKSNLLEV